jgi:hypothetical protein
MMGGGGISKIKELQKLLSGRLFTIIKSSNFA